MRSAKNDLFLVGSKQTKCIKLIDLNVLNIINIDKVLINLKSKNEGDKKI